jgi:hypothetical protein
MKKVQHRLITFDWFYLMLRWLAQPHELLSHMFLHSLSTIFVALQRCALYPHSPKLNFYWTATAEILSTYVNFHLMLSKTFCFLKWFYRNTEISLKNLPVHCQIENPWKVIVVKYDHRNFDKHIQLINLKQMFSSLLQHDELIWILLPNKFG